MMKMDIEGAEVRVLEHLLATGAIERVRCLVETHEKKMASLAAETARLKAELARLPDCRVHWDWI
ncbi:MAG: hypothetical protein N2322_04050 [Terrimicrobiaceae bacterium]|nr:hypothetical protein [Terrimicrobiaceae bacterium]